MRKITWYMVLVLPAEKGSEIFGERQVVAQLIRRRQCRRAKDRRPPLDIVASHDVNAFRELIRGAHDQPKQMIREIHGGVGNRLFIGTVARAVE